MNENNSGIGPLGAEPAEVRQRLLRAWREIKARPALLPLPWFRHVDELDRRAEARAGAGDDPSGVAARQPGMWSYETYGRVLGMLAGGAYGGAVAALSGSSSFELLSALRTSIPHAPALTEALTSVGALAARARGAVNPDDVLVAGARRVNLVDVPALRPLLVAVPVALTGVFAPEDEVFRRARAVAERSGGESADCASAAVLALALRRGLEDGDLAPERLVGSLLDEHDDWGADDALRGRLEVLAEIRHQSAGEPASAVPARLGQGMSASEVLVRALYLAGRFAGDRPVLEAASAGDTAVAVICGLLVGARRGAEAFPMLWRRKSEAVRAFEVSAETLFRQYGPEDVVTNSAVEGPLADPPPESAYAPSTAAGAASGAKLSSPHEAAPQPPRTPQERFTGSLLAGAVGDALGYAVEFHDIGAIRNEHGAGGLTEPVLRDGVARVSDDTQMMLFTLEGLVRAHVARRIKPVDNDPIPEVQHAYQRWFHTQNRPWGYAGGPYSQHLRVPDGWLITNPALFAERAPGGTCLTALENFARTHRHATPQHRINDSKGCGGVMRAAPVAVWSNDPAEVFWAAVGSAALTHGHPSGFLPAGVLAVIVHQLIREVPLPDAVRMARDLLVRWPQHEEQLRALDAAVELARRGPVDPDELTAALGQGWVGEEALAIGLYAVLATGGMREALLLSVNHSGDSDSTGMVCGNIAGALYGTRDLPPDWLRALELRDVIEALSADALTEFSPAAPTDASWTRRYPAW